MPRSEISPLDWRQPIVDPETGVPTLQFIRLWQQLFGNEDGTHAIAETAVQISDIGGDPNADRGVYWLNSVKGLRWLEFLASRFLLSNSQLDLADKGVTYAKIQDIAATARFLGRITAGAGVTEELTGTQATTLLDAFTSALKGLVPASGGGTTNFLRADATWAAPPGGGGGGILYETTTAVGTLASAGTATQDLITYTMPGGTLTAGHALRITMAGTFVGSTRVKTQNIKLGSTTANIWGAGTATNTGWFWSGILESVTTTSEIFQGFGAFGPQNGAVGASVTTRKTAAENLSTSLNIVFQGQVSGTPVNNDIVYEYVCIELL